MPSRKYDLPPSMYEYRTAYRTCGEGGMRIVGCGFMDKSGVRYDHRDFNPSHYSLCYCLRGRGSYTDNNGAEHALFPGVVFQRIPGRVHTTVLDPESNWVECFIALGGELAAELAGYGLLDYNTPVMEAGLHHELVEHYDSLYRLLDASSHVRPEALVDLQVILAETLNLHSLDLRDDPDTELIAAARRILSQNPEERLQLPAVAEELGVGYERLRKLFLERTGMTLGQVRIRNRIDRACSLLMDRNLTVKEIALQLGYPNPYAFSAQFKQITGHSPNSFRAGLQLPD